MRFLELNGINYIKSFCNKNILTRQSVIVSFKCSTYETTASKYSTSRISFRLQLAKVMHLVWRQSVVEDLVLHNSG